MLRLVDPVRRRDILQNESAAPPELDVRVATAADAEALPRSWNVCLSDDDGNLLQACKPEIWTSPEHTVGVRRYGVRHEAVVCAAGDRDGRAIDNRDHLILLGSQIMGEGFTPVELYPRESRVQDYERNYLWGMRDMWTQFEIDWIRTTLRTLKTVAPGISYHGIPNIGVGVLRVGFGATRNWRGVQDAKNRYLGAHVEAVDVLMPWTAGLGAVLFAKIGIESALGFGWDSPK